MNIDIRQHIKNNFKNADTDEIKVSIESSISEHDEITLPGMGVFFEILWNYSDESSKEYILKTLKKGLDN
ncbi:MAG: small acid-soluble spore protein SspI [Firmicutes bacterium]|nr:small acid-soluble spore protein SspI [Bacillota bacterium]